jgi:hypothetical protein
MRQFRHIAIVLPIVSCSVAFAQVPVDGQPAADVLASEDLWGNPTFIGGVTNKGPDSGSVW